MAYCIYIKQNLSKQATIKNKTCKLHKKQVTYNECKNCPDFILKRNKTISIKSVGKNKPKVSKTTYEKVFNRDNGRCQICGTQKKELLHLHHINGRSKTLTDDENNCIMLCYTCHKMVHDNQKKYRPILMDKINNKQEE